MHVPVAAQHLLKPLQRLETTRTLDLLLGIQLSSQDSINEAMKRISDQANPSFRQFIGPADFDKQFAASDNEIAKVVEFARSNRLQVVDTPGRLAVHVRGRVADIEQAFKIEMQLYQHPKENRKFYSPDKEPSIPAGVPISHVTGFDNFVVPHSALLPTVGGPSGDPPSSGPPSSAYFGKSYRLAYAPDVSATGKGQVLGILGFDGYWANDFERYEDVAGIPHVHIQNVFVNGFNGKPSNDNTEISMDMENAISMAPGMSQLTIYGGQSDVDCVELLMEMARPTQGEPLPSQISTSYFFFYDQNVYAALNRLAMQGQAFFSASGDSGAFTPYTKSPTDNTPFPPVDFPGVTAVGGTLLRVDPSGRWASETTWRGSSGGVSPWQVGDPAFNIPSWQVGLSNSQNRASVLARNVPDIAMVAANIAVLSRNGIWSVAGGTSAAAPLWAAFWALANEVMASHQVGGRIGFANPPIYAIGGSTTYASSFHDIDSGNNSRGSDSQQYAAVWDTTFARGGARHAVKPLLRH